MKLLSPRVHGYLDYLLVVLFFAAPGLFDLTQLPTVLSWVAGAGLLVMSLCTAYPLGAVRLVPFAVHGALELVAGLALVLAPWVLGFREEGAARTFFLVAGIGILGLWAVTDYRAADLIGARRREA